MTRTVSARLKDLRSFLNYLVNWAHVLKSFSLPAFSKITSDFFTSGTASKSGVERAEWSLTVKAVGGLFYFLVFLFVLLSHRLGVVFHFNVSHAVVCRVNGSRAKL